MDFKTRIERALERALALADDHTPPKLVGRGSARSCAWR